MAASNELAPGRSRLASAIVALGGWVAMIGAITNWATLSRNPGVAIGGGLGGGGLGGAGSSPGRRRLRGGGGGGGFPSASPSAGAFPRARRGGGLGGTAGGRGSLTVHGLDTSVGKIVLGLAIAIVVVGLLGWVARAYGFRLGALAVGLVAGVIAVVLSVTELFTIDSDVLGAVRARVAKAAIHTSFQPGVYLAIGGSALAVIAALIGLAIARRDWASGPAQAPAGHPYSSPPPYSAARPAPTEFLPRPVEPPSSAMTEQIPRVQPPPPDAGPMDPPATEPQA